MPRHPKFNNYRVAGDTAILELTNRHGEFARLNFPDQPPVLGKAVGL